MNDKMILTEIIQTLCYGSKAEFARALNISPQTITNWMNRGISKEGLTIIQKAFPNISSEWLLTGEGEMLRKKPQNEVENLSPEEQLQLNSAIQEGKVTYVPLVNIDSVGGVHSPNVLSSSEQYIERMIPFPDARPGDVAILQSGNSMSPTIPAGAILQIRRVDGWREYFGYGSDFVLWLTDERRITKQVLKYDADPKNYVTCHSYNPESADEELPKSMIKEVWKIINVLINKGW